MSRPIIREGMRLEPVKDGNIPGANKFNEVQAICEGLANSEVITGSQPGFKLSNKKAIFTVPSANTSASTSAPFQIVQSATGWNVIQVLDGITTVRVYPIPSLVGSAPFTIIGGQALVGRYALTGASTDVVLNPGVAQTYIVWATYDPNLDAGNGLVTLHVGLNDSGDSIPFDPKFPLEDDFHFIIGAVVVNPTTSTLIFYQMCNSNFDFISGCVPGAGGLFARPMVFDGNLGDGITGVTWRVNSSVGLGLMANGFPANGTYIYAGAGAGQGGTPGTAWTRLA